jgi:hypothetical protein
MFSFVDALEAAHARGAIRQPAILSHRCHDQHVRTVGVRRHVEVLVAMLAKHGWRKGPEAFAELDLQVHHLLRLWRSRIAKDRSGAECARSEFHPSLEPADDFFLREQIDDPRQQRVLVIERVKHRALGS